MGKKTLLASLFMATLALSARAEGTAAVGTDPSAQTATPGRVEVKVTGLRSARGNVFMALWRSSKKFPGTPPKGTPSQIAKIVTDGNGARVAEARFDGVRPGEFAITVFHDEDGDTELKTNILGIPKEGIGFSRDARARVGAPDYDDAKLTLAPGQTEKLTISIWYL